MTALEKILKQRIAAEGPLTVARFMEYCLSHPEHGYYQKGDPFGARGDFITAPEISQMFGELIGIWCAVVWQGLGRPDPFNLVELGPGRGTLMLDALRACEAAPGFLSAVRLHLVETSRALRAVQKEKLDPDITGVRPQWHDRLRDVPPGPTIFIANEFFDALPIHQFQMTEDGWRQRRVDVAAGEGAGDGKDTGGFRFTLSGPQDGSKDGSKDGPPPISAALKDAAPGAIAEAAPAGVAHAWAMGERIAGGGGAALIIDYGHAAPGLGDTLQAVRGHRFADPLAAPGEADLTAHVDFAAIAAAIAAGGGGNAEGSAVAAWGPVSQARFLTALGIQARAHALMEGASAAQAHDIEAALARLTGDDQMGELFKVLAAVAAAAPPPPGFEGIS